MQINRKFVKVGMLNTDLSRGAISQIVANNLDQKYLETPKLGSNFLALCLENGVDDAIILENSKKLAIESLKNIPSHSKDSVIPLLSNLFDQARILGSMDPEVFNAMRNYLVIVLRDDTYSQYVFHKFFISLAMIGCRDDQIWNFLLNRLQKYHVNKFYLFQKRTLHTALKQIAIKNLVPDSTLRRVMAKISILSNFCISDQLAVSSFHLKEMKPSNNQDEKFGDCCDQSAIETFKNSLGDNQYLKNVSNQKHGDNPLEKHVKIALEGH
jgi:hypothetical protein